MGVLNSIATRMAKRRLKNVDPIDLENAYNSIMCIYFKDTKEFDEIVPYNKVKDFCNSHSDCLVSVYVSPLQFPPYNVFKYVHDRYMQSKNIFLLVSSSTPEKVVRVSDQFLHKYRITQFDINSVENMLKHSEAYHKMQRQRDKYLKDLFNENWLKDYN